MCIAHIVFHYYDFFSVLFVTRYIEKYYNDRAQNTPQGSFFWTAVLELLCNMYNVYTCKYVRIHRYVYYIHIIHTHDTILYYIDIIYTARVRIRGLVRCADREDTYSYGRSAGGDGRPGWETGAR